MYCAFGTKCFGPERLKLREGLAGEIGNILRTKSGIYTASIWTDGLSRGGIGFELMRSV